MREYTGWVEGEGSFPRCHTAGVTPHFAAMRQTLRLLRVLIALGAPLAPAAGQVRPDIDWRTVHTTHFRVHYGPGLERLAQRTAANAEFAYAQLATELVPPRGIVDVVLADNVDFSNGSATPHPTNRIIIYARPPVEAMSLRNYVDWNLVLVTHELAHVFHLDRARGWWRLGQRVFGRASPLFPNTYAPSWMIEGLAVHYETRITQGGRLAGSEFPATARAAALGGRLPALHQLSLAAPRFPLGSSAYVYGAYAMTRAEPGAVARFVEASSGRLIPWHFNASAKQAFGESFQQHWRRWSDSVALAAAREPAGDPVRVLTRHGYEARFPRFLDDTTLIYVASDERSTTGVYRLTDAAGDPHRERLARRNSIDVNSPAGGLGTVHAEFEWSSPYTLRSDLYHEDNRGVLGGLRGRERITRNERLASPDFHEGTGRVVAVHTGVGTTDLVVIDDRGEGISRRIATGTLDLTWSEPRWSHDGRRVVAARWERGGTTSIVVLDSAGTELRAFSPRGQRLTIVSSPVWVPGDTTVLFVSDHEGRAMIYRGHVDTGAIERVWSTATALNTPDVSPNGRRIAAVELGADGFRVVTREMPAAGEPQRATVSVADSTARARAIEAVLQAPDSLAYDTRYSPWDHLNPSWWLPSVGQDDAGTMRYGLLTAARDVIGRHDWEAEFEYQFDRGEITGRGAYTFAGFGNPVLTAYGSQEWMHGPILNTGGDQVGLLALKVVSAGGQALLERRRVRLSSYVALGAQLSQYRWRSYPDTLILGLPNAAAYRAVVTSQVIDGEVGFSTMQRPGLAVSAEDGLAVSLVQRVRLNAGVRYEDVQEQLAVLVAAKSLPLPGYAKHVLGFRAAYAVAAHPTTNAFTVGGVSGSSLELLPGVTYNGSRRTFFVRGFEPSTQLGVRAAAASLEYRAPLFIGGRGVSFLPLFFQKSSLTAFADAGAAWCSYSVQDSFICPAPLRARTTLGSVGAELALDAALEYDTIYRFRFGVARPVKGERFAGRTTTFYFALGSTF